MSTIRKCHHTLMRTMLLLWELRLEGKRGGMLFVVFILRDPIETLCSYLMVLFSAIGFYFWYSYMINWINGHPNPFKALVCHDGIFNQDQLYFETEELWFPEHDMVRTSFAIRVSSVTECSIVLSFSFSFSFSFSCSCSCSCSVPLLSLLFPFPSLPRQSF